MGLIGVLLYVATVRWAVSLMAKMVSAGEVNRSDLARLTVPAYVAGGILFVAAAVFNPVGPSLILASGAGASLGLTFGLLLVPRMIEAETEQRTVAQFLPLNWSWIIVAVLVAAVFIGVFGPGVRLP
jgi:hypothetical protein